MTAAELADLLDTAERVIDGYEHQLADLVGEAEATIDADTLDRRFPKATGVDTGRAARAVRRARPDWSLERTLGAIERLVRAVAAHTDDGYGGLDELGKVVEMTMHLDDVIDTMALHLLEHDDASYQQIGEALGISRQAVAKRYPNTSSRTVGAQPGNLR